MLFYILATCIISATGYSVLGENYPVVESDADILQWPERYSIKAIRASLTSNIVEDYTAWKTNQSSRVDYNKGAVKVMTTLPRIEDEHGLKYEIHPETTEQELNKIVCHFLYEALSKHLTLDEILPTSFEYYEKVGDESIDGKNTVKLEYNEISDGDDIRNTIWAYYDDDIGWIPVRYEMKKYAMKLGSLISHEIWTYSDFIEDFDDEVFDFINLYGCDEQTTVKHAKDSKKITKELMFINPENEEHVDHVFSHFQNKFERKYVHEREHALRRTLFKKNMRMISSVNKRNLGYKLGVNEFSDWTPEELKRSHGAIPRPKESKAPVAFPYKETDLTDIVSTLPKQFDMRVLGLISPVKHQGTCGSCWTFAATAATESGLAKINGGRVLGLSNQALVDCAYELLGAMRAGGCDGGFDYAAYEWIMKHGLPTEQEYGIYKNRDDYCRIGNMTKTYPIRGYTAVTPRSNNAMKVALVNHGPLFVYIHASKNFQAYSSGIFYEDSKTCQTERGDHAVTVVGFGELNGDEFWIVKNSWGVHWGADGYILMSAKENVCGVASHPSYPVL